MPNNYEIEETTHMTKNEFLAERLSRCPSIDANLDSGSGKRDDYRLVAELRQILLAEALSHDQTLFERTRARIENFWKQLRFSQHRALTADHGSPIGAWGGNWIHASMEKTFLEKIYEKRQTLTGK